MSKLAKAFDDDLRHQLLGRKRLHRVGTESLSKISEFGRLDLQSRGHLVAAIAFQMGCAGFERMGEMKPGDRSRAALAMPIVERDHNGGAVIAIDEARRDDANHARMPTLGSHDDRPAAILTLEEKRMHLIWTLLIGLVIGAVAKFLMPGKDPGGIIITMLIGIAGSFVATYAGRALGWYQEGQAAGFIMSVLGAIVLLALYHMIRPKTA